VQSEIPPGFLVLPATGDRTLFQLKKKLGLLVLHELLVLPPARSGALQKAYARFQGWLEESLRSPARAEVRKAADRMDVVVPVLAQKSGLVSTEDALSEAIPALVVAVARAVEIRGALESLLWDVPIRRLFDADRRRVLSFDPPALGLLFDGKDLELRTSDGASCPLPVDAEPAPHPSMRVEEPFLAIGATPSPALALADVNPLSMLEEHPDKSGNAIDLGGRATTEWTTALAEALSLIERGLPELHREIIGSLERIVPVGFEPERHLSASYREAPGLVYLTLHPSALTLAEAIVHETQHGKLNVLRWFDPVLENGDTTWSRSAVRPDLRPLSGVLLAVHAFVPVAALHLALAEAGHPLASGPSFERRRAEVLAANAHGLRTLKELGKPTAVGRRVIDGLEELQAVCHAKAPAQKSDATVTALG
jgi:HEXXH motif-containing protein